jgi:hypothetical protein
VPDYTALKTPGAIGDSQLTQQLMGNVCAFLDWALLGLGGYYNVKSNTQQPYGGDASVLRLSDDPRYTKGMVWDGFKNNWVWEQGIDGSAQPIQISGIYVNNVFFPNDTSTYNISYPQGRVMFYTGISPNSVVQVEYSYKATSVYPANVQWFKELMQQSFRLDNAQFKSYGSGIWSTFPESRAQLPAVVVESVPRRSFKGYQIGGGQWLYTDIYLHVLSSTVESRDNLLDILTYQNEKKFFMFDKNMVAASGAFPINQYGYLVNPGSTYPNLLNNFLQRYAIIRECTSQQTVNDSQSVQYGVAKWRLEISMPEI